MPFVPAVRRALARRPLLHTETLAFFASAWFALACNGAFWRALGAGNAGTATPAWLLTGGTFLFMTALQWMLSLLVMTRWTAKPVLFILFGTSALTVYFMNTFQVFMDPPMLRNVLGTDWREARDLLSWAMVPYLAFYGLLPSLLLWRVQIRRAPWHCSARVRPIAFLLAVVLAVTGLAPIAQDLVPQVREHKQLRYLVTPGNYVVSLLRVATLESGAAAQPRMKVGTDAYPGPTWKKGRKPVALVIVVGETVRAANWGLDGYARQTTPELAALGVIDFTHVTSCGTNTETSLPCMFSAWGRHDYDDERVRHSESLLHVLHHAGIPVLWRDNQSGCKGVCDGLPQQDDSIFLSPTLCDATRCFDEALLNGLAGYIDRQAGNVVIVLHQMGNHGPAYFRRYPEAFRHWTPTCDTTEFGRCSREAIVNSYDNAVLYTDHVLAETIGLLQGRATHDTALIYLSDHGESLGENNLYLHSLPRAIAPDTQTHIPMVIWLSPGFAAGAGIDKDCLARHVDDRLSHDNLFHTALGMLDIGTKVYSKAYDVTSPCRK